MDLERALETQRVRLLRLLTGWFAVVALLSGGPFALPLPRWVRAFLSEMLTRAEYAAQCLVLVSAGLQAKGERGGAGLRVSAPPLQQHQSGAGVPTTVALIRRMKALRRLLQDLPRRGRRLLRIRRAVSRVVGAVSFAPEDRAAGSARQWIAPGEERPPDKVPALVLTLRSRPFRTGGVCVGCSQDWIVGVNTTMTR